MSSVSPQEFQQAKVRLDSLIPAERNANVMEPHKYEALKNFIRKQGFLQPILVRPAEDGRFRIVDGHHRSKALGELGYAMVPAIIYTGSAPDSYLALGMNGDRGQLDYGIVALELKDLVENFPAFGTTDELVDLGFSLPDLDVLLAGANGDFAPPPEPSSAAEVVEKEAKPFVLEITFSDKKAHSKAVKALRKADPTKSGDLAKGLLFLLDQ